MGVQDFWAAIFSLSIATTILLQFVLWWFLRSHGVPTKWFLIGTPGYLDQQYIRWRKQHDQGYWLIITLRILLPLSAILSAVVLFQQ